MLQPVYKFVIATVFFYAQLTHAAVIDVGTITGVNTVDTLVGSSIEQACFSAASTEVRTTQSCYYNQNSNNLDATIDEAQLAADITFVDPSDPIGTMGKYVFSVAEAYMDLAFTNVDIYNGAGDDLVFFFAGNDYSFQLDLLNGSATQTYFVDPDTTAVEETDGTKYLIDGAVLSAVFVDLDDFGYASDIALGTFRITTGDQLARPFLSTAGGFYTEAVVVPLPLPIVLLVSGLSVFGFFARNKKA